jgi:hypothetical protein
MRKKIVGSAALLASAGFVALGVSAVSTAATAGNVGVAPIHEEQARDSGSGRFEPTYVPAGFTLVNDSTDDFAEFPVVNGTQSDTPIHHYGRVLQYSTLSSDQRVKNGKNTSSVDQMTDVRSIYVVVVPVDPSSKLGTPQNSQTVALRGRQGVQFNRTQSVSSIKWRERPAVDVQVTGNGVDANEVLNVARSLHEGA